MASTKPVVMLVDDEPRILSSLRRVLRREGYEILLATNGREALDELATRSVDVVISDHKMPGVSGVELLERIAHQWPSTARILLSGWSNEIPAKSLAAAKLGAVLTKPWEDEELKQTIRDALAD